MRNRIIALLESYPAMKMQIEQLRFELENPSLIGEKELLDSLSVGAHTQSGGGQSGHISDRTMAIALRYQDAARRINKETITEIMTELRSLETEVNRLEFYISFLDEKKAAIIRLYYFEAKTLDQMVKEIHMSKSSIARYRTEALNDLTEMYSFIDKVKGNDRESGN